MHKSPPYPLAAGITKFLQIISEKLNQTLTSFPVISNFKPFQIRQQMLQAIFQ